MAGDPSNARIWADADVYVAFPVGGSLAHVNVPADINTVFDSTWEQLGLLDGEEGFTETRDEDTTDHFAWGGILVRTARRGFKLTRTFHCLESSEDNPHVFRLRWPGSTSDQIVVPSGDKVERVMIAFEKRDGSEVSRLISTYQAEVTVDGDISENETDPAKVPFMATIFPDGDGNLFTPQNTGEASS